MRKVVVLAMVSIDGVMQAPAGPEEDPTGGFQFGGWVAPLADVDPVFGAEIGKYADQLTVDPRTLFGCGGPSSPTGIVRSAAQGPRFVRVLALSGRPLT
jgi:hypothetical protein